LTFGASNKVFVYQLLFSQQFWSIDFRKFSTRYYLQTNWESASSKVKHSYM